MITIEETARAVELQVDDFVVDDAQRAAVAFPARSSGRDAGQRRPDQLGLRRRCACCGGRRRSGHLCVAAQDPSGRLDVGVPPTEAEGVAGGVGVDLVPLDSGQVVGWP